MALTRNRVLVSKIETTEGVNVSPSATTDAAVVLDLEITVDTDEVERKIATPWLGNTKVVYSKRKVNFKFDIEVAGSGTAGTAPAWGRYLQACGFSQTTVTNTNVYSPISSGFPSLTMVGNQDGVQYVGLGCRGSVSYKAKVGEIPTWSFEFSGAYVSPTDVALPTPTYSNQAEPIHFASGNTTDFALDGFAFCMEEFSMDLKNELSYRELVGCAKSNKITQRAVEGEFMLERPDTLSIKNLYPKVEAHTLVAAAFTHGTVAGNKVKIELPTLQLAFPEGGDSDGILMHNYKYRAIPQSPGNNEVTITAF